MMDTLIAEKDATDDAFINNKTYEVQFRSVNVSDTLMI